MKRPRTSIRLAGILASVILVSAQVANAAPPQLPPDTQWRPVGADRLGTMRGGFVSSSGLVISFGIERVATVNGGIVAVARVNIPDLSRITSEQAQALAAINQTQVVQVGGDVTLIPGSTGGLVIQNALDGQRIGALTTVNVGVSTLGLFQELNLNSALTSALISAATSP